MESNNSTMCSTNTYGTSVCYTSGLCEGSSSDLLHEQSGFLRNENNSHQPNSLSDQSPGSEKSLSQQFRNFDHNQNLNQGPDKFDDEHFVDDDFDDDDDDDDDADDDDDDEDDDGIVLDCEDDHDSLNSIDSPYTLFKKQMKSNRNYLIPTNEATNENNNFLNGNTIFPANSLFQLRNQQFPQSASTDVNFNNVSKSSTTETYPYSINSERNQKSDFSYSEYQEKKKKFLDILKQNGKLEAAFSSCNGCGEPIFDSCLLKVEDRPWHTSCLKCKVCSVPLTSSCFFRNEQVYCREDFMRKFGSKCSVCDETIPSTEAVRRANDNVYHLDCFRCCACQEKLETGNEFYLVNGHQLMCKKDFENQASRDMSLDGGSKRPRTSISAKQLETLKSAYNCSSKPARHVREELSSKTGLDLRVVQVWFQNRRAKEKRLNKETEHGKYNQFRGGSLNISSFEHELNATPLTKRSNRSGNHGSRKRSAGSSGRLHISRLGTAHSIPKHEIINQSYPTADPSYTLSPLTSVCSGSNANSLHRVVPNEFPVVFPQTINSPINNSSSHSLFFRENTEQVQIPFTCLSAEAQSSSTPSTIDEMCCYTKRKPLLSCVEGFGVIPDISGPSKLASSFSIMPNHSVKGSVTNPLSRMSMLASTDCFGNRFASQSRPGFEIFSDVDSMATLNEISSQSRPWLNEQLPHT